MYKHVIGDSVRIIVNVPKGGHLMKSVTPEPLDFVMGTDFEDLPDTVVHESKRIILDSIGCAVGGLSIDEGKISVALAKRLGGPPEASIIGTGDRVSCANAAFANGELVFALDYCNVMYPTVHVRGRFYRGRKHPKEARQSDEWLINNFKRNTAQVLPSFKMDKAPQVILELETVGNVSELMKLVII